MTQVNFFTEIIFLGIIKISQNDMKTLIINEEGKPIRSCPFTQVFDPLTSQLTIFENTCLPLINDLIENKKSGLIFAYGITNSGKTYTITGTKIISLLILKKL
jgi:hypothetical protein